MTARPDLVALSSLLTWLVGHVARHLAVRAGWSRARRALIPRLAPVVGAALGYGLGALLGGSGWQDALHGALGGALAVWGREVQPRLDADNRSPGGPSRTPSAAAEEG